MASAPKRKLRPEEDPNYNPMDDLAPPGNLPLPVRAEKSPMPRPVQRPLVRSKEQMDKAKEGKATKKFRSGGSVSSASKRADGCATKGKTRGKFV